MFILAEVPRLLLPLMFVEQPRIFPVPIGLRAVSVTILIGSLLLAFPVRRIVPFTAPSRDEPLRTDGLYSLVRHPLMLCDILWPLGWSLLFGSIVGIALSGVWLLMIWVLIQAEEEALTREYGEIYRQYQARVPRLFPGVPPRSR